MFVATDDVHVVLDYRRMSFIMWMKHGWKCRPRSGQRVEAIDGLEGMTVGPTTADMQPTANHGSSVSVTSL